MRQHLQILKALLEAKGIGQKAMAAALGKVSPSAAGMKLRGERDMDREELRIMCELAGITIVHLASISDDLVLTKYPETAQVAAIFDSLPPEDRAQFKAMLEHMAAKAPPPKII